MNVRIAEDWKQVIGEEFDKPYFAELAQFVRDEYSSRRIFPAGRNIFRAFDKCPFDDLKVVIIGQDPYHGEGQANGLCFSVGDGVPFPPSLQNIFKEVHDDTGVPVPQSGNLDRWAEQGVLLLNAVLTVRAHEAASHAGRGWEQFTGASHKPAQTQRSIYALGQLCPAQGLDSRCGAQLHSASRTPLAAVGISRILRLPPLLAGKRLSRKCGKKPDCVVGRR